jgi:MFS transporter, DHA3 family, macrolide efflux protein
MEPLAAPTPARSPPSFRRTLASRPFFLLWSSQLISQSGDFIFDIALIWLVLQTTGSVFAVGLVVTAALIPAVLLGPVVGVYVDRWPRRTLLLATNLAEGALVAGLSGLVLAHVAGLDVIIAVVFALGVGSQFVRITSNAVVPQTVATDDLAPANSLLSFSNSTTQVLGLSVGGIVVALFGAALPIEYDAITFLVAALILGLMSSSVGRPEPPAPGTERRFRTEFYEGLRYIRGQRFLLELIVLGLVVNFCGNAIFTLWAPYADLVLHGGAATYGFLGAAIAAGSIVGAVVVGKVDTRRSAGKFLFAGGAGIGGMIILLGLTRTVPYALLEALLLGILLSVANIPLFVMVQAKVPSRLLGRVMAVLMSMLLAAAPLGAFFAGSFAQATSIGTVYIVAGAIILTTVGVGVVAMKSVRTVTY